jgi:hypothetical protein
MSLGDVVAPIATAISVVALVVSLRNRRSDIAREEAYQVRARVWTILDREPGLRTVLALHEPDGKTDDRVSYLRRTAAQVEIAGAPRLAHELADVLDQPWGIGTIAQSLSTRAAFVSSAARFLMPPPDGGQRGSH